MADETLRFNIIGHDEASGAFSRVGRAAGDMGGNMNIATRHALVLDEALRKQSTAARSSADATLAGAKAAKILADAEGVLSGRTIEAELALKREAEAAKKSGRAAVEAAAENSALADSMKKVAGSGLLKPTAKGSFIALAPALIPLAGGIAGAVGAIGISFGAAAIGAGLFGLAVKSVLGQASTNLAKLQALELRLNTAATPAARKSAQAAITALKATWAPGYLALIGQLETFKKTWSKTSQTLAIPALSAWLPALTKGLPLLKTAVKPVADVFQLWGQMLKDNFANPAVMNHLQGMAAAFGKFSASQLTLVGRGIADIVAGVFHLGKDLAGSGANFSAAGIWFMNMGAGFLTWSKSSKARADVQGFMHYLHQEGPVVRGILQSLGKILPGIFAGATTAGNLELKAIGGLLSLIAKLPKGWQAPLTEAAGAMLLLSKTGVLKVGFTVIGAAAGWIKKLLGGASVDVGAAGMQTAGDTMLTAAGAMQKAADTMAGAGAAGRGAGAAGAGAAAGAARGGTMAALGAASVPVAVGIIGGVAIAQLVNSDAASRASQAIAARVLKQNNLTPGKVATGKQTGGVVPGVPSSAIGSWRTYDTAVGGASSSLSGWNKNAGISVQTGGLLSASVVAMRDRNRELSVSFRNNLIPDLNAMHANTPKVRTDVQRLALSILDTGNKSQSTRSDRQKLITDFQNAGFSSKAAKDEVKRLEDKIAALHGKAVNITAHGSGSGSIVFKQSFTGQSKADRLLFSAAGMRVPGHGNADTVHAMLTPGEAVVPRRLVPAVAPFLSANRVPGFASGGFVAPENAIGRTPGFMGGAEAGFMKMALNSGIRAEIAKMKSFLSTLRGSGIGGMGDSGARTRSAAVAQAYARSLMSMYGWAQSQMNSLIPLWNQESGWSAYAVNPSSGAYGIPQSLGHGHPYNLGDYKNQIIWGLNYIKQRKGYGSPAAAWAHEQAFNWYDDPAGSWMPPGPSLAYNGTGKAEHLTPDSGLVPLLGEIADGIAELISVSSAAPHHTGRALGDALNGVARSSAYSSMYGSR